MSANETKMFREALKFCIDALGWGGQRKIANKANLSPIYLNNILKGRTPGSEAARAAIAGALGYTYEDFLRLGRSLIETRQQDGIKTIPVDSAQQQKKGRNVEGYMNKKPGITLERHKEIGRELKNIYNRLLKLYAEFTNAYPESGPLSRPSRKTAEAIDIIISLKHYAEENMYQEHRGDPNLSTSTYYGPIDTLTNKIDNPPDEEDKKKVVNGG
ncbi:hypothetical protein [Desulfovulcanus sp.]